MPNFPTNPTVNQIYIWQGHQYQWNGQQWVLLNSEYPIPVPVFVSASPPVNPKQGTLWYNTTNSTLFLRISSPGGGTWEEVSQEAPPFPPITRISASPPSNPNVGDLWFNPSTSTLSIRYNSPSGSVWLATESNVQGLPTLTGPSLVGKEEGTGGFEQITVGAGLQIQDGVLSASADGSVTLEMPPEFVVSGSGTTDLSVEYAAGYSLPSDASQEDWDEAYADRLKWDGGSSGLDAAAGRQSLELGTVATLDSGTSAGNVPVLDGSGKISSAVLPSYVDDVLEFPSLASFPVTGSSGVIYLAIDTGKIYRWGGSSYVEISPSPGSTDAVPEGIVNLYFRNDRAAAAAPVQSVAGKTGVVSLSVADVSGAASIGLAAGLSIALG